MVRHWNRLLRTERDPRERRRIMRSRAINAFGAQPHRPRAGDRGGHEVHQGRLPGAHRDADPVRDHAGDQRALHARRRASSNTEDSGLMLPARNHVVVLVSKVHKPTLRALAYRAGHPAGHPHRADRQRRRQRDPHAAGRMGAARPAGAADRARVAVSRGHQSDPRIHQEVARATVRATSSACSSPSTSSGTGGSTCCTTSRRCA